VPVTSRFLSIFFILQRNVFEILRNYRKKRLPDGNFVVFLHMNILYAFAILS